MPITSQTMPTGATPSRKCSATVTSHEAPCPGAPSTAKRGRSYEPTRNDSGPRHGRSDELSLRRIWITDAWASVNDSMAPKAYRLPRNAIARAGP